MDAGRIDAMGDPRGVFARPRTPFVARFLGLNVLRGHAVGAKPHDGGGCAVEVALAGDVRLTGILHGAGTVAAGTAVLACVRKEHVAVAKGGAAAPASSGTFAAVLRAASFLGLAEEYLVAAGAVELGAIQPPRGLAAGDAVAVTIRREDCIVFVADATDAGG
jgi:ABC-type Fe3+/spermidine/putrescine transport system ATPase subunit